MSTIAPVLTCDHIYAISRWGEGYFHINAAGHLCVCPDPERQTSIDLYALCERLHTHGLSLPLLVRCNDLLRHRVRRLHSAFATAIARQQYGGNYHPVYPIKVNQQRSVVESILSAGDIGLEAGSKAELLAVLALIPPGETVICNGYKDREYIRLALIGRRLGLRLFIVIEKLSELALVISEAARLHVEPLLGVRVRLAAAATGKWQNSGGEKAKFGLSATQLMTLVAQLRAAEKLHWLQLLHAHLGSQIPNVQDISTGVIELAHCYAELRQCGASLNTLDFGGGLGVDYEGTRTRTYCSTNYTLDDYATAIVAALTQVCQLRDVPPPHLITESGRALSAHHAVLITNVVEREVAAGQQCPAQLDTDTTDADLTALAELLRTATGAPPELFQRAKELRAAVQHRFMRGEVRLAQRARAEDLYAAICQQLRQQLTTATRRQRELLDTMHANLADKLFCNFSLFQSLPDVWAIDQIFPIVPLQRLNEVPTERAIIQDLTCDSDGCIAHYVDQDGIEASLPVHSVSATDAPYLIGFFMVGAYQEILGDIHNLFGDTDAVNVELDATAPDGYRLLTPEHGDATEELLRYVHFEPRALLMGYRRQLDGADLDAATREQFYVELKAGLYGYPYLGNC